MGVFADYARRLFEQGYSVIPLNGKIPLVPGWQKYCSELPTDDEITDWENRFPDCNIGLPGGPANGVAWLDCDAWTEAYGKAMVDLLPLMQIWRVGQKGFVTPIKYDNQKINKIYYRDIEMGDVLGVGHQVAAIGVHPVTGQPYEWHSANGGLFGMSRDELVDIAITLTDADIKSVEANLNKVNFILHMQDMRKAKKADGGTGVGGRNNRLKEIAGAMFERGCQVADVAAELRKADKKDHAEPLFEDKAEFKGADPDAAALTFATSIFSTYLREKTRRGEAVPQLSVPHTNPDTPEVTVIDFERNRQGQIVANIDNVVRACEGIGALGHFWYDEFYDRIRRPDGRGHLRFWIDADDLELTLYMQREIGMPTLSLSTVQQAVELVAHRRKRNEPRDWFDSLAWDGTDRIDQFLTRGLGADDNEFNRKASRNWWIAMVKRIYDPGCKFDNMVVLEGGQGKFKSTALGMIGGNWFLESGADISSKDFLQSLNGKMLIEIAELDGFGKADVKTIKRVLSTRVDTYRPSYGRRAKDFKRQCVFVGSTNEDEYLEDPTGGRRFWPVKTGAIDLDYVGAMREQLFAEAVFKAKRGDTHWEMPDSALDVQATRLRSDLWAEPIVYWLTGKDGDVRLVDVATEALRLDHAQITRPVEIRLGAVMRTLGWEKRQRFKDGHNQKVWVRTETAKPYDSTRPLMPQGVTQFKRW